MNNTTWSVQALTDAATTATSQAAEVASLAGHVVPVSAQCCGELLASAFSLTFPAATQDVCEYIDAMSEGVSSIGANLASTAGLYRTTEEAAIVHVDSIWKALNG